MWVRFKDGTLMLTVYPSGDTYTHLSDKGVLDWRWQAEVEEPAPAPTKVWSCGWNIPGYLPVNEPMNFETWEQARAALLEELHLAVDDAIIDEEHQLYLNAIDQLGREDPEFDWTMRIGNYAWWIQHITLPTS